MFTEECKPEEFLVCKNKLKRKYHPDKESFRNSTLKRKIQKTEISKFVNEYIEKLKEDENEEEPQN